MAKQTGKLTTHVLDTANGKPGQAIALTLFRVSDAGPVAITSTQTNADGRCDQPLLDGASILTGTYQLEFRIGDYYRSSGNTSVSEPAFLENVVLQFSIADADQHYHVPLLVSPYGYSTYRGS